MADHEDSELPPELAQEWRILNPKFGKGGQSHTLLLESKSGARGVLKIAKLEDAIARARFKREVDILVAIDHRAIVKLLAWSAEAGWYLTPEGRSLRSYWGSWCQGRSVEEVFDTAVSFVRELLNGLTLFHGRGGIHRDIKPENVIVVVDPMPRPVLIDFGIAYELDDDRITETDGPLVGTNFASPAEALHRKLVQPTAQWDCLQVAWLLGWMLKEGRDPKFGRYHWRHHTMIGHPLTDAVRALLAATTEPDMSPGTRGTSTRGCSACAHQGGTT